jgi:hypothetical protein
MRLAKAAPALVFSLALSDASAQGAHGISIREWQFANAFSMQRCLNSARSAIFRSSLSVSREFDNAIYGNSDGGIFTITCYPQHRMVLFVATSLNSTHSERNAQIISNFSL